MWHGTGVSIPSSGSLSASNSFPSMLFGGGWCSVHLFFIITHGAIPLIFSFSPLSWSSNSLFISNSRSGVSPVANCGCCVGFDCAELAFASFFVSDLRLGVQLVCRRLLSKCLFAKKKKTVIYTFSPAELSSERGEKEVLADSNQPTAPPSTKSHVSYCAARARRREKMAAESTSSTTG